MSHRGQGMPGRATGTEQGMPDRATVTGQGVPGGPVGERQGPHGEMNIQGPSKPKPQSFSSKQSRNYSAQQSQRMATTIKEENEEEAIKASVKLEDIPTLTGYEGTGFNESECHAPPPNQINVADIMNKVKNPADILEEYVMDFAITEEEIRDRVVELAQQHQCWGKKFGRRMEIKSVTQYPGLQYSLDSHCEERKTRWKTVPFSGGFVDGPDKGMTPSPWDISIPRKGFFQENIVKVEVPHTSVIHICSRCGGSGEQICSNCGGEGLLICYNCWGSGWEMDWPCYFCRGRGLIRCINCIGSGRMSCRACRGCRQLKSSVELIVRFHNVSSNWVYDRTNLPSHLLKKAHGKRIFEQCLERVAPIQGYKVNELNQASYELLNKHYKIQEKERIHYQGHHVDVVPLSEIVAVGRRDATEFVFWIYGFEKNIYFPDYPDKSCCSCS